jgi:tetratricopeptide (TPR) repeat protein
MRNFGISFTGIIFVIAFLSCGDLEPVEEEVKSEEEFELSSADKARQDSLIEKYVHNGAKQFGLYSQERRDELDKGLAIDSTVAYMWQQKAMPLFKQGKYELGMPFLDKAVLYNRRDWQEYRAFMKCIFAKQYRNAIADFKDCKERFGNNFVMDHTYDFYMGISHLMLNEFEEAEELFKSDYDSIMNVKGPDWLHHLDLFYYGISLYEQKKYTEAIVFFNEALVRYPTFSDVQAYKAKALYAIGKAEEATALYEQAKINGKKGMTINEDNEIYERYPYQVRWY